MTMVAEQFAAHGYRSLGVAHTGPGRRWRLLGVVPLADPPRADSAATITAARDLPVGFKGGAHCRASLVVSVVVPAAAR